MSYRDLMLVDDKRPQFCPCGCGARLLRSELWRDAERSRMIHIRNVREQSEDAPEHIRMLLKRLVTAIYWYVRRTPSRIRSRAQWRKQADARKQLRLEMSAATTVERLVAARLEAELTRKQ
jgi:hypothetical protein